MWICRTWTQRPDEFTNMLYRFETKEEAEEFGKNFVSLKLHHEISREYEVYEDPFRSERGNMNLDTLNKMSLQELKDMEPFGLRETFNSVVIVPTDDLHDSGFRCMKFILVRDGEVVGCVGGGCDTVQPNGIGNRGRDCQNYICGFIPYMGMSMDCLAGSGCVRIMMYKLCSCADFIGSDFMFYLEE